MVFRILSKVFRASVLLMVGAGIGVWFAPPTLKLLMRQKLAVAEVKASSFHKSANRLWTASLQLR
jgi:hypothetical protein